VTGRSRHGDGGGGHGDREAPATGRRPPRVHREHRRPRRPLVVQPASFHQAVRTEIDRTFRQPYEVPIVVVANGAIMCGAWFLLPGWIRNFVFTLHGPLAFALVLSAWMYSDVPATNVLGPDHLRTAAALDDPRMLRRLLYAKNLVLWLIITPPCTVICVAIGLSQRDLTATVVSLVWIVVVPFGGLGISNWVGVLLPYHPIPLRDRWAARRQWWHMLVRWGLLAVTPYLLVPALAFALMSPTLLLWGLFATHGLSGRLPDAEYAWGIVLACGCAVVGSVGGHRVSTVIARRRRTYLTAYLGDPARG